MSGKGTVLVLGAGLVTRPLVHYLAKHGFHVVLASRTLENAQKLIDGAANTEAHQYDITKDDETKLDAWTQQSVAVISMLPYVCRSSCLYE
jgi:saccharopine dehydrogenase-like NADP-dependent oxidoreductase